MEPDGRNGEDKGRLTREPIRGGSETEVVARGERVREIAGRRHDKLTNEQWGMDFRGGALRLSDYGERKLKHLLTCR
jgi:hypothetical protein